MSRRPPHLSRMRRPMGLGALKNNPGQKSFANLNAIRDFQRGKDKKNEMTALKKKLKQSLEFGSKLVKEKKKLEKQVKFAKMVCTKFEVKLRELQQELDESTAMNERYAEEVRELKNQSSFQAVETQDMDRVKNEYFNLQKESERLSDSNAELRRKVKDLSEENEILKKGKEEFEHQLESAGKYEEQYQEERTERIRLSEELQKVKDEKDDVEISAQRQERVVKKLKVKNTKMEDDFNLRLKVIQNNFSISLDNMRMTLVSLRRSFNNERLEIEEEMTEQVQEVLEHIIIQSQERELEKESLTQVIMEEVEEKKRAEFQQLVFQVEKLEEEKKVMEVIIEEVKSNKEFVIKEKQEQEQEQEAPKKIRPKIDESSILNWLNKFMKPLYHRNGHPVSEIVLNRLSSLLPIKHDNEEGGGEESLIEKSVKLFSNGFLFCGMLYRFHPSMIDFEVDVEDEESSFPSNCTLAFDIFESKFGVEKTISPDFASPNDAEELPYYLDKVMKSMKSVVDKTKNKFKKKVKSIERDLTRLLTKFKKKRVKKVEELNELVKRKKEYLTEWNECQFLFNRLCEFYSSNTSFLDWYKNCHVDNQLFELSTLIIDKRKIMKSGKSGRRTKDESGSENEANEVNKLVEEYNKTCSEYFTWSKKIQEYFLNKDSEEAYAGDSKINAFLADFEDPKLTLQEKQKEIERENDILLFSLKGMSTQNIKSLIKSASEI